MSVMIIPEPHVKTRGSTKPLEYMIASSGCWECVNRGCDENGYPQITRGYKDYSVNRYVYELYKGKIPDGLVVRHTCDNRKCINPDHLLIGTVADNNRDRMEREGYRTMPKGEDNHASILCDSDVRAIIDRLLKGESCIAISEVYGVSPSLISNIKRAKSWRHIERVKITGQPRVRRWHRRPTDLQHLLTK